MVRRMISGVALAIAGLLLLIRTGLGLIAVLGFGIDSIETLVTMLCLTLALPIYLVGLFSLRGATIGLWVFFGLNWTYLSLMSKPLGVVNPFSWPYGSHLIVAAILVQLAYSLLARAPDRHESIRLADAFFARI